MLLTLTKAEEMKKRIVVPKYLIAKDETGIEFLFHTTSPKFVAAIDRSINIASTQLNVLEWWDECASTSRVEEDAKLWLINKFLKEKI